MSDNPHYRQKRCWPLKYIYLAVGCIFLAIGAVGAVLPVLPTTPFLLITAFCFAKGSRRFHEWFTATGLYKKHLESYVQDRSMTLKTKLSILFLSTTMMTLAIVFVPVLPARIFLVLTILFHWWYFFFRIRTK